MRFSQKIALEDALTVALLGMLNLKRYRYQHPCDP